MPGPKTGRRIKLGNPFHNIQGVPTPALIYSLELLESNTNDRLDFTVAIDAIVAELERRNA